MVFQGPLKSTDAVLHRMYHLWSPLSLMQCCGKPWSARTVAITLMPWTSALLPKSLMGTPLDTSTLLSHRSSLREEYSRYGTAVHRVTCTDNGLVRRLPMVQRKWRWHYWTVIHYCFLHGRRLLCAFWSVSSTKRLWMNTLCLCHYTLLCACTEYLHSYVAIQPHWEYQWMQAFLPHSSA